MNHLERAARLANNAASTEDFFEDYFDLLDPVGAEENIQCNRRAEENAIGMEINYMGHLLVNDVEQFRSLVWGGPAHLVNDLVGIADTLELVIPRVPVSRDAYEELYDAGDVDAFAWQDSIEDSLLLGVRRLFRQYVIGVHCFLYVSAS